MTLARKAGLDYEMRVFLAQRLRAYYNEIRQIPVSESLSNLLKKIENRPAEIRTETDQRHRIQ